MKNITDFLKTTLVGGVLIVLPLLLFYMLLSEILGMVVALATPIADLFPKGTFDEVKMTVLLAVILIVVVSFVFGLALRSSLLRRFGLWIENKTLGHLPIYKAVKSLSRGLAGAKEDGVFKPAILTSSDGSREIVYLIEEHDDGQATILVPWTPTSFAGSIKILSRERIELLSASLGDTSAVLSNWGVGAKDLLNKNNTTKI